MATHSSSLTLVTIPPELLASILLRCSIKDILMLRQCCRITEAASRERSLWLHILAGFSRDWDISFDQFHPHDLVGTSSRDLELAVTAQYRLYHIMGTGSPENLPRLSPKVTYKITATSPWRTFQLGPGGRWLAAIFGQVLRIYRVGISSSPTHAVVCEQECSFLPDSHLDLNWGSCFDSKSYLTVEEYGGSFEPESQYWMFSLQVETKRSNTPSLSINHLGIIKTANTVTLWMDDPSFPVLLTDTDGPNNFLWSQDGGRVPVSSLDIDPGEVIYRPAFGGCACWFVQADGLDVWQFLQPPSDGSPIALRRLGSFDWLAELESDTDEIWDMQIAIGGSSPSPEGYSLRFAVLVSSGAYPEHPKVEFVHKALILETEHNRLVGCRLEDLGRQTVTNFPSSEMPTLEESTLHVCGPSWFMWFTEAMDTGVDNELISAGRLSASLDGQTYKGASVLPPSLPNADDTSDLIFCIFSGRGVVAHEFDLYILDYV
ncbi:hypothetical protein DL96DRAFT_1576504 [Flagelloscypha sp. PMI_526]|nr:hypothetical protein DL96DRAFT_1576504 [Flagelloscypha sp. PMI_526]